MSKSKMNFSFDVGMASLGVAVNRGNKIIHADALLIHLEAGSIKDAATKRRQYRTRQAHKQREQVLEDFWRSIGKEPLQRKKFEKTTKGFKKTPADRRLEQEFPYAGDNTAYASSLLRIMLLEGHPLEDWQIYKALSAAIQRKGYDHNVPWKTKDDDTDVSDKDLDLREAFSAYIRDMPEQYQLPCYFDAARMGLWCEKTKKIISVKQGSKKPERARGYKADRKLVDKELRLLLEAAAKRIPEMRLSTEAMNQLIYGKAEIKPTSDKRYPSYSKITGLLGQKYPRFENRIVSKCALIPRLNVCKSSNKRAIEVGFLMKLLNLRYELYDEFTGDKQEKSLNHEQIKQIFQELKTQKTKDFEPESYAQRLKLTNTQLKKRIQAFSGETARIKSGHETIEKISITGRSRFSQPALYLLKHMILQGLIPRDFHADCMKRIENCTDSNKFGHKIFKNATYRFFKEDFECLKLMDDKIYTPSMPAKHSDDVNQQVVNIISSCNWPELRHRLNVFDTELQNLVEQFGQPESVNFEFIREDFLSLEKKTQYESQSQQGRDEREAARISLAEANIKTNEQNILRYRLLIEQKGQCPYTGEALSIAALEHYDIDHVFPTSQGGPDAYYNKVLTSHVVNQKQKADKLPCEFIENWNSYTQRIDTIYKDPKNSKRHLRKQKLLSATSRDEAEELIEKYTGLSGTSYIARLARDIVCARFGWIPGAKDETQKVFIFGGGLTSKIAKDNSLYKALSEDNDPWNKPRHDHRHHALDAMVISYLKEWARDETKADFFTFPKGIDRHYFKTKLDEVYPHYVSRRKPALSEQPKKGKDVNRTEFRNISKDPEAKGQWHTSKTVTGEGTFQHGHLIYLDRKDKVRRTAIHSFRSRFQEEKIIQRDENNRIIGFIRSSHSLHIKENLFKAVLFGGSIEKLPKGEYSIEKIQKKCIIEHSKKGERYRIDKAKLEKQCIRNKLLAGQVFVLQGFRLDKATEISGQFRYSNDHDCFINEETDEQVIIKFDRLVTHLHKNNWLTSDELSNTKIVEINTAISGHKDDKTVNNLPAGYYLIKQFQGNYVHLRSQQGLVYKLTVNILNPIFKDEPPSTPSS